MRIGIGAITLETITRFNAGVSNAGAVTLTANPGIEIGELDLGSVFENDLLLCVAQIHSIKGITAGLTTTRIEKKSGTATILAGVASSLALARTDHIIANVEHRDSVAGFFTVVTAGTLILRLMGWSDGSDSTVSANSAWFRCVNLAGQVAVGA